VGLLVLRKLDTAPDLVSQSVGRRAPTLGDRPVGRSPTATLASTAIGVGAGVASADPWVPGAHGPFSYWGYNVQPVWDTGYNQWGFWLGGIWIPL
jgi:hypothetical protein